MEHHGTSQIKPIKKQGDAQGRIFSSVTFPAHMQAKQARLELTGDRDVHLTSSKEEKDPTKGKISFFVQSSKQRKAINSLLNIISLSSHLCTGTFSPLLPIGRTQCLRSAGQVKHEQSYKIRNSTKHHAHATAGSPTSRANKNANVSVKEKQYISLEQQISWKTDKLLGTESLSSTDLNKGLVAWKSVFFFLS